MLGALAPRVRAGDLHALDQPQRAAAGDAREPLATGRRRGTAEIVADPVAALERAREIAGEGGAVLVTGSIYLLSDLARAGATGERAAMTQHARMLGLVAAVVAVVILRVLRARLRPRQAAPVIAGFRGGLHPLGYTRDSQGRLGMTFALFGIENDGLNLAVNLLVFFLFVIWVALVYWTYADASRRLEDPMLVGVRDRRRAVPVHRHDRLHDRASAGVPGGPPRARDRGEGGREAPRAAREPHLPQLRR